MFLITIEPLDECTEVYWSAELCVHFSEIIWMFFENTFDI